MSVTGARIGATTAIILFAILAMISGFDRMTETRQAFERFVPSAFQVGAAKRHAARALGEGDLEEAIALSRVAVARDPMDARGLAFLGAAAELSGDRAQAARAFGVSSQLGHRNPLTQIYLFSEDLARGNFDAAASRVDALLRAGDAAGVTQTYLAMLEASPEGRRALASRLGSSPQWANAYLSAAGADAAQLRTRADFLARDDADIGVLGCEATMPMILELARGNFRAEADGVARRHCPQAVPSGVIADNEFEQFGDDGSVSIGWRRYRTGDVRVTRLSGDEARIELENRSSVTKLVLSQPVALETGRYRVAAKVDGPGGQRLIAALNCTTPSRPQALRERIDQGGQALDAPTCSDAILSLWLRPGAGRVVVDRIDLEPVTR
ncbi:hypothetical protein [Qipengyuania zhejiangensis]|uniref:hypothetical protein n=1 Tax=Qipengyuania zhejiangensis TaxID=3077782 RepID=UPI002D79DF98|nr:hypothetical protein [Qipengyuania sp. Z2]